MKLGLVGSGIDNSTSPDLHHHLGRLTGIPVEYSLYDAKDVGDFDLGATIVRLRSEGFRGLSITFPFKQQALSLADNLSDGVRCLGATNTLLFENDGTIRAENTDFTGFISAYRFHFNGRLPGRVVQLGAGGVGCAVGHGLRLLGAKQLLIADPDTKRAEQLAAALKCEGLDARVIAMHGVNDALNTADGIVNCSFIGHQNHPGCPVDPSRLRKEQWVFDAVYVPARTELIVAAELRGLDLFSGVELFIFQGINAFKLFANSEQVSDKLSSITEELRDYYVNLLISDQKRG